MMEGKVLPVLFSVVESDIYISQGRCSSLDVVIELGPDYAALALEASSASEPKRSSSKDVISCG